MEWKWIIWNGRELEWNWNGNFTTNEIDAKWNGNGMEMDWKWNGNFITKENDAKWNGNGMELKWKWNGYKWPPRHGS